MRLTADQIRSVTAGAVAVRQEEDGIHFTRFTEEQLAALDQPHLNFPEDRLRSSAGIKLCFRTNSERLGLSAITSRGTGRAYYAFDLAVDGKTVRSLDNFSHPIPPEEQSKLYPARKYQLGPCEASFDLGPGEKRVCLHLPWSVQTVLTGVELDDGATLVPDVPARSMLAFGDSITTGFEALHPSRRHIAMLADALGLEERNKSVNGSYTAPALARGGAEDPTLILVAYGTNDWSVCTEKQMRDNYAELLTVLTEQYPGVPCACLTPIWRAAWQEIRPLGPFSAAGQIVRETAARFPGMTVIDCIDFVPHEAAMFGDGTLHPSEAGCQKYYEALLPHLRALLGE